jgi:hypothetical protein
MDRRQALRYEGCLSSACPAPPPMQRRRHAELYVGGTRRGAGPRLPPSWQRSQLDRSGWGAHEFLHGGRQVGGREVGRWAAHGFPHTGGAGECQCAVAKQRPFPRRATNRTWSPGRKGPPTPVHTSKGGQRATGEFLPHVAQLATATAHPHAPTHPRTGRASTQGPHHHPCLYVRGVPVLACASGGRWLQHVTSHRRGRWHCWLLRKRKGPPRRASAQPATADRVGRGWARRGATSDHQ